MQKKEDENLKKEYLTEKQINRILSAEIRELRAINYDLRTSLDSYVNNYQRYINIIERFKRTVIFRCLRRIKRVIRK